MCIASDSDHYWCGQNDLVSLLRHVKLSNSKDNRLLIAIAENKSSEWVAPLQK